jgi:hypothetical protein
MPPGVRCPPQVLGDSHAVLGQVRLGKIGVEKLQMSRYILKTNILNFDIFDLGKNSTHIGVVFYS